MTTTPAADTHIHHNPAGWTIPTLDPNPQNCTVNHQPDPTPCTNTAAWKITEHYTHNGWPALTLSFWCDTHLPDEHRPPTA